MAENGDDEPTIKLAPGSSQALRHQFASMPATDRPLAVDEEPTVQLPSRPALPAIHEQSTAPMSTASDQPPVSPVVGGSVPMDELPTTPRPVAPLTPILAAPPAVPPSTPKKRGRKRWPRWARILVSVFLLLLLVGGGALGYAYYYFETNIQKPLEQFIHPVSRGKDEPAVTPTPNDGAVTGRVWNILLLGSDNDGKYTFPAVLTQVMMVVHIDTIHNQVYMVSIPRDSWVYVPEVGGMHKIDQAFFLGATQHDSFNDGVRLARLTIEKDYGITIDRYAWVGLSGFASVINTLGGVDIDVTHPIVDDSYPNDTGGNANANDPYALKRLYLAPGPQHLNGEQALEYVRSRHADLVGDIGRTQRQQQVLEALKTKLNATNVFNHLSQLITDMQGQVYTDLSEQEMIQFANYARGLNSNAINHLTLGPGSGSQDYGDNGTAYDPSAGQQDVVIPHCQNIQPAINKIFGLGNANSCNVKGP